MGRGDRETLLMAAVKSVLNYLIRRGRGCCALAAFPALELRRHRGKVVNIRGTVPCWICHDAKTLQNTSGDVILNVIFN